MLKIFVFLGFCFIGISVFMALGYNNYAIKAGNYLYSALLVWTITNLIQSRNEKK